MESISQKGNDPKFAVALRLRRLVHHALRLLPLKKLFFLHQVKAFKCPLRTKKRTFGILFFWFAQTETVPRALRASPGTPQRGQLRRLRCSAPAKQFDNQCIDNEEEEEIAYQNPWMTQSVRDCHSFPCVNLHKTNDENTQMHPCMTQSSTHCQQLLNTVFRITAHMVPYHAIQ